jgi:hypothetical protein
VHLAQEAMERIGGLLVEVARRLVGEQDGRLHDERAGHRHALLFASGQHAGTVFQPLAEADALQ